MKAAGLGFVSMLIMCSGVCSIPVVAAEPAAPAEGGGAPTEPTPDGNGGIVRLVLADGSQVSGTVAVENIIMVTPFGKLVVPLDQVLRLRVGRGSDPKTVSKVKALIGKLGSTSFDERQKATDELIAVGPGAADELRAASKHEDAEVRSRAEKILGEIEEGMAAEEPEEDDGPLYGGNDELVTRLFTARGKLEMAGLEVITRYGKLNVPRDQVVMARFGKVEVRTYAVEVSGSNTFRNMVVSKVRVRAGEQVRVVASGTINFNNWGVEVGPGGNQDHFGENNGFPGMCLLVRIGNSGDSQQVGEDLRFRADKDGDLCFGVNYNGGTGRTNGSWKLKVTVSDRD